MPEAAAGATSERGWGKLLLALAAFLLLPHLPPFNVLLPVEETLTLFLPALAACCLVGWWAGGRLVLAVVWAVVAIWAVTHPASAGPFSNLVRGWSLLLAGAFGLTCLFGVSRPFFARAIHTFLLVLAVVAVLGVRGPFTVPRIRQTVQAELARRTVSTMTMFREAPTQHPEIRQSMPQLPGMLDEIELRMKETSRVGASLAPSLLLLESLVALALCWTTYHRIARTRLGAPLAPLKDFRFNDQLVWGLIAGLTILFVPALAFMDPIGRNLLVFFGALYAIRGFGVLSWFLAPGTFAAALVVGFAMLWWPVLNLVAASGFMLLALAAFGLGLGDTWADWRRRARPTA